MNKDKFIKEIVDTLVSHETIDDNVGFTYVSEYSYEEVAKSIYDKIESNK